jgi:hypothetical protein
MTGESGRQLCRFRLIASSVSCTISSGAQPPINDPARGEGANELGCLPEKRIIGSFIPCDCGSQQPGKIILLLVVQTFRLSEFAPDLRSVTSDAE